MPKATPNPQAAGACAGPDGSEEPAAVSLKAAPRGSSSGERPREADWVSLQAARGEGGGDLPAWAAHRPSLLWLRVTAGARTVAPALCHCHCACPFSDMLTLLYQRLYVLLLDVARRVHAKSTVVPGRALAWLTHGQHVGGCAATSALAWLTHGQHVGGGAQH